MTELADPSFDVEQTVAELQPAVASTAPATPVSGLVVGRADDPYEAAADRAAEEVQRRLAMPSLRRSSQATADPLGGQSVSADTERAIRSSSGRPLDAGVRAPLEQAFGADFGSVRIHDGGGADRLSRSLQAEAFTVGSDVFFKSGNFAPNDPSGQHLLAHELAHVVQDTGGAARSVAPVRRFMDLATFRERTAEGKLTRKSSAQKHIEQLLLQYTALKGGGTVEGRQQTKDSGIIPDAKLDQAIALVTSMKSTAESWIVAHSVTDDSGTVTEDPNRVRRMAGMKWFITETDKRLTLLAGFKLRATGPQEAVVVDEATGKIKEHYEGSATSMLERIAFMLDLSVPTDGDSSEFELEFKIPCDPSGVGFVGGILRMDAERDEGFVKARAEILVTGGANVGIAEIKGGLGGYIEASAKDAPKVMKLVSYGMYRRLRESNVPAEVSNFIWGGQTGDYGQKKADQWSRDIESQMWGDKKDLGGATEDDYFDNTYVETGGVAEVGAKLDLEVAELGVGAKYTEGLRYDKQSLDARKGGAGKANVKSDGMFTKNVASKFGRGAEKRLGRTMRNLELKAEASAGPFEGSLSLSLGFESTGEHGKMNVTPLKSIEVGLSLGASLPSSQLLGSGFGPFITSVITATSDALRRAAARGAAQTEKDRGARDAGAVISAAESVGVGVTQLAQVPAEAFKLSFDTAESAGFESSVGVTADLGFEWGFDPPSKEGSLDLKHTKGYDYKIPKALEVSLTRSRRLLKISYDGAAWKVS